MDDPCTIHDYTIHTGCNSNCKSHTVRCHSDWPRIRIVHNFLSLWVGLIYMYIKIYYYNYYWLWFIIRQQHSTGKVLNINKIHHVHNVPYHINIPHTSAILSCDIPPISFINLAKYCSSHLIHNFLSFSTLSFTDKDCRNENSQNSCMIWQNCNTFCQSNWQYTTFMDYLTK